MANVKRVNHRSQRQRKRERGRERERPFHRSVEFIYNTNIWTSLARVSQSLDVLFRNHSRQSSPDERGKSSHYVQSPGIRWSSIFKRHRGSLLPLPPTNRLSFKSVFSLFLVDDTRAELLYPPSFSSLSFCNADFNFYRWFLVNFVVKFEENYIPNSKKYSQIARDDFGNFSFYFANVSIL